MPEQQNETTTTPDSHDVLRAADDDYACDGTKLLNPGDAFASCAVTVVDLATGEAPTGVVNGAATLAGNVATQRFTCASLVVGHVYLVTWAFRLTSGLTRPASSYLNCVG